MTEPYEKYGFTIESENEDMRSSLSIREKENSFVLSVRLSFPTRVVPKKTKIRCEFPLRDPQGVWSQQCMLVRNLPADWAAARYVARSASSIPMLSVYGVSDVNLLTVTNLDAETPSAVSAGYREEDSKTVVTVELFVLPVQPLYSYETKILFDFRPTHFAERVRYAVGLYDEKLPPAPVPSAAKDTVFSTWYCYHQHVNEKRLLKDCKSAKELGMDVVIIDDGWQTSNTERGYAFCGDYEVCKDKISDMRALVDELHGLKMKAMLWFAVPFIGDNAKAIERFRDKTLYHSDGSNAYVLDPRYKEVREHILSCTAKAVREWDMDGLKLDFVNAFELADTRVPEGVDCETLEEGIRRLLQELHGALTAIKSDILIEFRQGYVGPAMRTLSNMLRVGDCPGSMLINRTGIVDLRLTSGKTAVHSDPLVWAKDATAEDVGRYFTNVVFSVAQISAAPSELTDEQRQTVKHYVSFMREYRKTLLDSEFTFSGASENYPLVRVYDEKREIVGVYAPVVAEIEREEAFVLNGTGKSELVLNVRGRYAFIMYSATGKVQNEGETEGVSVLPIPSGGMIKLNKIKRK